MTRSEKRRLKINAVQNATGDKKLAQAYRDKSEATIYNDLGIKLPKKIPKLKPIPKNNRNKLRQIERFQFAKEQGFDNDYAFYLKKATRKQILYEVKYAEIKKIDTKYASTLAGKEKRIDAWREWSRHNDYPYSIINDARKLNLGIRASSKIDVASSSFNNERLDNHYGYVVMFYSFTAQMPIEDVQQFIKGDRVFDVYEDSRQRLKT